MTNKLPPDAEAEVTIVDGDGFWGEVWTLNTWDPSDHWEDWAHDEVVQDLVAGQPYVFRKC